MDTTRSRHHERLLPRWWVWLLPVGIASMLGTAYGAALGVDTGWLVATACLVLLAVLIWITSPTVRVDSVGMQAARAVLPWQCIGAVRPVSADEIRDLRGPGADGRLYVTLRPWAARGGVLVTLDDAQDPHPAWLISSRHPERLAAALAATMGPRSSA